MKRVNFAVESEEQLKIKVHAYSQGLTVKDYIMQLVRNDMEHAAQSINENASRHSLVGAGDLH